MSCLFLGGSSGVGKGVGESNIISRAGNVFTLISTEMLASKRA